MKEKIKSIDPILVFIFVIPFIYGTLYDFSSLLVVSIIQLILIIYYIKNKKIKIELNMTFICLVSLALFSFLTIIWAVDKNDAMIGGLRYLSVLIFAILLMQLDNEKKNKIYITLAYSALTMLIISLLLGIIPATRGIVFLKNYRLKGFFEYSNTFALFLLLGLIVITQSKRNKVSIIMHIAFIAGIILTGSRTTLILTALFVLAWCFSKENKQKKTYLIIYICIFVLFILYVLVFNQSSVLGRLISFKSTTLLERFVYWKDGISLLKTNLFGHGYMGYSYKIYSIQTGPYETRFVHNEYLQMAIDIGIMPTLLFIGTLIKSIVSRNNSKLNKILLVIIMIHMLIDIDLQYLIIWIFIILALDSNELKEKIITFNYTTVVVLAIIFVVYLYYGIATLMFFIGNYKVSQNMINNYTEANTIEMIEQKDLDDAHKIADKILKDNRYVHQAYGINASYYYNKLSFEKMVENKKQEIALDKYNEEVYKEYILLLSKSIDYFQKIQDFNNLSKYINYVTEVEEMVKSVNENINKLEKEIYDEDTIELKLSDELIKYIEEMKSINANLLN